MEARVRRARGVRRSHAEIEHRVYRDIQDPNRFVVHNDLPSEDAARGFMEDPSLKEVMERAGVEGEPGISFRERTERKVHAEEVAAQGR